MSDSKNQELVLVVDFGAQYAQLIARRVRQAQVYSEIVPSSTAISKMLEKKPTAIILSGGPSSVYEAGAPTLDPKIFEAGIPIFGICYGFQVMAAALGGVVTQTGKSEFGRTALSHNANSKLLAGLPEEFSVWMSHGDSVTTAPAGFTSTASTADTAIVAFENSDAQFAGVQFHPEVLHSENGQEILRRWLIDIVGCKPVWNSENIVSTEVEKIRALVGSGRVLCGLSGGVDSAVAAAIVQKAVGSQLTCVFVDHGLLREGEAEQVERDFVASTGVQLVVIDAKDQFLNALQDVTDPEEKRKIIGREFIRSFEAAARDIAAGGDVEFLVQGTLYPDVVESGGGEGTANIKSHHNVGGLPDDLKFKLIEPLRTLFKDEVRQVGLQLGLPEAIIWRQPFPGPGLGILLAFWIAGPRVVRGSVPGAVIIHFFGGIHEIYFPYILMKPRLILAAIAGGAAGVAMNVALSNGLTATPSPGSIFAYMVVTPKGDTFKVLLAIAVSAAVSFVGVGPGSGGV